ncbi:Glutamate-gated kainate-type ion channel receptor subunit GluR5 [Handroanthus impetiginosus]|uniref:Glutamate receptor n=1 Tax=Handroanthus impetiginosus TaxID=429701 RepID=A0A2G9G5P0_9LAMI|nr:Glutamate-gated kainate-type ion channel receptor subunit GluR5 [Handroanthus impetiginosus]
MSKPKSSHAQDHQASLVGTSRKLRKSTISGHYKLIVFLLISFHFLTMTTSQINIGVLLDDNTRIGKEMRTAVKIACQNFNNSSTHDKILTQLQNPSESPLQAVYAAEELVKEKNVQSIIGMSSWEETALVATVAKQAKVPIISFAESAIEKPVIQQQWPFLVHMGPDLKQQIKCITDIVNYFQWAKVIVIYEIDLHGSDSGAVNLLSESLQIVGVEIEHRLVLPPFSSLSNPGRFLHEEVANLSNKQSRVFIVLKASLAWGIHLFREAKELRLVEKDSAWIISDPLAGLLDSLNASVISSMEGVLGVTTYFSENMRSFQEFKLQFQRIFRSDYPDEDNCEPSIYALRAYDSITAIGKAIKKSNSSKSTSTMLLKTLLSSNFKGLSGLISFQNGELIQPSDLKIVNVIGKKYKELGVWSSKLGFLRIVDKENRENLEQKYLNKWFDSINWPGELKRIPRGWSTPTEAKPMKIGVPGRTSFEKFVKVTWNSSTNSSSYSGFCIDIFYEVLKILEQKYPFPHEFIPFNGSYDELVDHVANKTFDAVVGDVTILANRSGAVEFTQPFAASGLTMVVTVKSQHENKAWIFLQPFTGDMWAVTGAILLYTVLIVWLLERRMNPEFEGHWWSQLNTALWFTCSSLFFAHREKVCNSYTRMVVLVWLCVVLALTSSYTASLSSLLTVPRLVPSVTDIKYLKDKDAKIGCDGDSFVRKYIENVLGFKPHNIRNISSEYDYPKEFDSGNITAAFLELPYEKAFLNYYCEGYTTVGNTFSSVGDRFGGLGFVFQKGSPLADDVSKAILTLSENGRLKQLEREYFSPPEKCSRSPETIDSLSWRSFWGLYLFSAGTSAICYLLFSIQQLYKWWNLE